MGDMPTIGQTLGETRRRKGLTVNDVAHATRIPTNTLLNIEENDFSKFPSIAYAKSFVRKYSEHLGIDLSAEMEHLNSGITVRLGDNEMIGERQNTIKKNRLSRLHRPNKSVRPRYNKPGGAPLFLNVILFVLIFSLGIFYFLGYNANSIEEAKFDIATGLKLPYASKPTGNDVVSLPGSPPQDPVTKPAVSLPFDETLPALSVEAHEIPANPLRPRHTPQMVAADEPVSPGVSDVSAMTKSTTDPQAILRPEGTNPPATRASAPPVPTAPETTVPAPAENSSGDRSKPPIPITTPIRAVPVATAE